MANPSAFIFDLNGTMVDDMEFHNTAWFDILNGNLKAGLTKAAVKKEMYGKNEELLDRIFGKGRFSQREVDEISMEKERRYQQAFLPHLQLIAGLSEFLKKAAAQGPVFITDRGRPAHVLLTIERYQELSGPTTSIVSLLSMPDAGDIDFDPPRAGELYRAADLG